MPPRVRPPRLARAMASLRLPADVREFVLGDLEEDFAETADEQSVRRARFWYWRQAVRCLFTRYGRRRQPVANPRGSSMHMFNDARFAVRWLRRSPGFTATAVLTLALGIGSTTAMFSVVHAVLFAPLPFANADRLVLARAGDTPEHGTPLSFTTYREWRDSGVFDDFAAFFSWGATLTGMGDPTQLRGARASASLFGVLGIRPFLGQPFSPADELVASERKVLIGYGVWQSKFAAARDIVGRRIILGDQPFTVVGVLPADFRLRPADAPPEVLAPLRLTDQTAPPTLNFMTAVARLKPGQTPGQARDALQSVIRPLHPEAQPPLSVTMTPLRDLIAGDSRRSLLALLGATGVLLLIACTNLAHLFLARAASRRQEMAVRMAIGAGRARLVSQLLTESLVLSGLGGAIGVALAWLAVSVAADTHAVRATGAYAVHLNVPVLLYAIAASVFAGVLFGIAPALGAGRQRARADLADDTRSATGRSIGRSALVTAEVALTLVLLAGAGLLARSLGNVLEADKGFDPSRVLTFSLSTPAAKHKTSEMMTQFFRDTIDQLSQLTPVESVGIVNELPLGGGGVSGSVPIDGRTFKPGEEPQAEKRIISPDYFRTLGIRVIEGRTFSANDTASSTPVIIVSEKFARRYFPDGALGKHASFDWDTTGSQEIVGVVADVRHYGLDEEPPPMVYVTYLQRPIDYAAVLIKSSGDPAALIPAARDVMRRIDKDRPLLSLNPMTTFVADSVATRRFSLSLVAAFAILGLVLAAVGVYGVVNYAARQRQREFGIRLALGATSGEIGRLVVRQGVVPSAIGLLIGIGAALGVTRVIQAQLFGVEPTDPATLAAAAVVLLTVCFLACYLPARVAKRVDLATLFRRS